jgi:hypothetical protein
VIDSPQRGWMSQNPAASHRRVLTPPAVTRFQLLTASATEAVFAPPFVAPRPDAVRYASRRTAPISYRGPGARERGTRTNAATVSFPRLPPAPSSTASTAEPDRATTATSSWELQALTAPDYSAPRSIHAPEHDSWPVAAPDGSAVPAWSGADDGDTRPEPETATSPLDAEVTDARASDAAGSAAPLLELTDAEETPELELSAAIGETPATPTGPYLERPDVPRDPAFPLDAFIVPTGLAHAPAGYAERQAARLADQLEALAARIREQGLAAVGSTDDPEQLARVIGAILAGYQARDS